MAFQFRGKRWRRPPPRAQGLMVWAEHRPLRTFSVHPGAAQRWREDQGISPPRSFAHHALRCPAPAAVSVDNAPSLRVVRLDDRRSCGNLARLTRHWSSWRRWRR